MTVAKSFSLGLQLGLVLFLPFLSAFSAAAPSKPKGIQVINKQAERRVDITVDGAPFTSYIFPETLKKPVLFPLQTAEGHTITRGFPLEPRPGERVDHPHHVGLWFNHGDVNGFDFWNIPRRLPLVKKTRWERSCIKKLSWQWEAKNAGFLK